MQRKCSSRSLAARAHRSRLGHLFFGRREVVTVESLTEQRRVAQPVVYGFLRQPVNGLARAAVLRDALAEYCERHELSLNDLFTEDTSAGTAAFTALLDVLAASGGYGVVVPSLEHLGPSKQAVARAGEIRRAGAVVIALRDRAHPSSPPLPRPVRRYAMPTVESPPLHELEARFHTAYGDARRMRVIAKEHARGWGLDGEDLDDIVLAVSELVTNAIRYAGPGQLHITHYAEKVRVEVEDGSPQTPPLAAETVSASQERGRGLPIIDRLSENNWGARPGRNGKTTWCEISLRAGGAAR